MLHVSGMSRQCLLCECIKYFPKEVQPRWVCHGPDGATCLGLKENVSRLKQ